MHRIANPAKTVQVCLLASLIGCQRHPIVCDPITSLLNWIATPVTLPSTKKYFILHLLYLIAKRELSDKGI